MSAPGRTGFLPARSHDEAHLFMSLRPCVCGDNELSERSVTTERAGDLTTTRFSGSCPGCGDLRRFTFVLPATADVSLEVQYGTGDEPSELIDAGEWLGVAQLNAMGAQERIDAGELTEPEIAPTYHQLTLALAAYQEALKFIPDDADAIPEGAFWTTAGRVVFESSADLLTTSRLTAEVEEMRRRVAEFEETYAETTR